MATDPVHQIVKDFNHGLASLAKEPETAHVMKAFMELHHAATKPGALDTRTKELMALAIAIASQCDGCVSWHVSNAVKAGATREQVLETIGVSLMMGGGPASYYATKAYASLESEFGS